MSTVRVASASADPQITPSQVRLAILVAALGYFVDIYDLILFSVVRMPSLKALGVPDARLLEEGVRLLNLQMTGLVVGGVLWGVLGDRRGRLSVLFGSIVLYSTANLLNAFVQDTTQYGVLRFLAGVGLAGELGAGVTLVSELMSRHSRAYGTTFIAVIGLCGAVIAGLVADLAPWRGAYIIGGGLGLAVLFLRIGVRESGMFRQLAHASVSRGNFFALFTSRSRLSRFLGLILLAVPIWYATGILVTFAPEFAKAMGIVDPPSVARAVLWDYAGMVVGDVVSGLLSQRLGSRRKAILFFLGIVAIAVSLYFTAGATSLGGFYACVALLGFATGYWAVFITAAAEQFGTNLRATVATSAPNLVRGSVVPMTLAFQAAKPALGVLGSGVLIGVVVLGVAFASAWRLSETHGRDLDFTEDV